MNKKYITALSALFIFSACAVCGAASEKTEENTRIVNEEKAAFGLSAEAFASVPISEKKQTLTDDEIALIALVTQAEAEGECEAGKRLVIDTVLNRIDSGYFPDNAESVIYQPNQFPSMTNGRAARCKIENDICKLVKEESDCRTNYDVIFFSAGGYSRYGYPLFKVGNHYFSSYDKTW